MHETACDSVDEFTSLCNGAYFKTHKPNGALAYGQVKLIAALWMTALARRHPDLRLITISPGNTSDTELARDFPLPLRLAIKYVLTPVVMPLMGIVQQPVEKGAARLIQGLTSPGFGTAFSMPATPAR
jgi:hypothetical protein